MLLHSLKLKFQAIFPRPFVYAHAKAQGPNLRFWPVKIFTYMIDLDFRQGYAVDIERCLVHMRDQVCGESAIEVRKELTPA